MKRILALFLILTLALTACAGTGDVGTAASSATTAAAVSSDAEIPADAVRIALSDDAITVDGAAVSDDPSAAVYAARDIVCYESGHDFTYGEGTADDEHSAEEASAHTVVHIAAPGTYHLSGTLSAGQIAASERQSDKKGVGYAVAQQDHQKGEEAHAELPTNLLPLTLGDLSHEETAGIGKPVMHAVDADILGGCEIHGLSQNVGETPGDLPVALVMLLAPAVECPHGKQVYHRSQHDNGQQPYIRNADDAAHQQIADEVFDEQQRLLRQSGHRLYTVPVLRRDESAVAEVAYLLTFVLLIKAAHGLAPDAHRHVHGILLPFVFIKARDDIPNKACRQDQRKPDAHGNEYLFITFAAGGLRHHEGGHINLPERYNTVERHHCRRHPECAGCA